MLNTAVAANLQAMQISICVIGFSIKSIKIALGFKSRLSRFVADTGRLSLYFSKIIIACSIK